MVRRADWIEERTGAESAVKQMSSISIESKLRFRKNNRYLAGKLGHDADPAIDLRTRLRKGKLPNPLRNLSGTIYDSRHQGVAVIPNIVGNVPVYRYRCVHGVVVAEEQRSGDSANPGAHPLAPLSMPEQALQ